MTQSEKEKTQPPPKGLSEVSKIAIIVAIIAGVFGLLGSFIGIIPDIFNLFDKPLTTAELKITTPTPELIISTVIPRIDKILEINFSGGDKVTCVTEDSKLGGYDNSQDNYFVMGKTYGYITYCNISDYTNQGSLEIKADPVGYPDNFGYGVLFSFVGGDSRDQCSFEIKKEGLETSIAFGEYIEGTWSKPDTKLDSYNLDTNPHTLRLVLYPEGNAIGYIDDVKIAEHKFVGCSKGRIGFIAYGLGDTKTSFDDLKLYEIP